MYLDGENPCTTEETCGGGCKREERPIPGSRFSCREEGELRKMRDNLVHNGRRWQTSYPFLYPRELLCTSCKSGLRVLHSAERSLKKNGWGEGSSACIEEMMRRQVAKKEGGPGLNQLLTGGPDRHRNNLAAGIIKIRAGRFAAQGDIMKMFNAVELEYKDTFLQCFLWRGMDDSKELEMYRVVVNNMGI